MALCVTLEHLRLLVTYEDVVKQGVCSDFLGIHELDEDLASESDSREVVFCAFQFQLLLQVI